MTLCPQCGAKVESSYSYCPACGVKIPPSSEAPLINKRKMPFWFKCLIGLAVIALIGVTAGILLTEGLVDVVDKQLSALRQKNIEKAYEAYTSKEFQQATSFNQFRRFIESYPIFFHNQSAHFAQRSIKDHVAILKGNLVSDKHEEIPIEYHLVKEHRKWKILSMRLLAPEKILGVGKGKR